MARAAAIELTALEHLQELMRRVLWSVGFMIAGGAISYIFRLQIIKFLQHPLHQKLYYTSPMGSFQFVMQVCLLCGLLCALPVLLYNILRFIEPAFAKRFTHKTILLVLSTSLLLTVAGAAFAYYVTLPAALRFFNTVGTNDLHALISVNEYFSFILGYLATFAIVFQLPLALLFIDHIKPFGPHALSGKRKFVYVGAFAVSLIMPSSPDPLSQVSLAIPIIVLYELSILLIWFARRRREHKTDYAEGLSSEAWFEQAITSENEAEATPEAPAESFSSGFNFAAVAPIMADAGVQTLQTPISVEAPQLPSKLKPAAPAARRHRNIDGISSRPSVAMRRANYQTSSSPRPIRPISDIL